MEREYKWKMQNAEDFDRIADSELVRPLIQEHTRYKMDAAYYDTSDGLVSRVGGGLRLRVENEKKIVCLKLAAQEGRSSACKTREEYETQAEDIRAGIALLPSVGAPQAFCDQLLRRDLIELGRTSFTRFAFLLASGLCTCELAFDYGHLSRQSRTGPICEMELEMKSGSAQDFHALASALAKTFHLEPQPLSKLARMLML